MHTAFDNDVCIYMLNKHSQRATLPESVGWLSSSWPPRSVMRMFAPDDSSFFSAEGQGTQHKYGKSCSPSHTHVLMNP